MKATNSARPGIQHAFTLLFLFAVIIVFSSSATAGAGQLIISPASVNFGNVSVGSSQTQSVTLTNSGGPKITLAQASLSGTGFTINGLVLPITLAGGQSVTCTVTFTPSSSGTESGSLAILVWQSSGSKKSNSFSTSTTTMSLSGTGVSFGQLAPTPSTVGFGTVQVGNSQELTETLSNTGGASLTVSALNVTGTGFSVSGVTVPFTLAVGQTANFSVVFSPAAAGTATGNIAVSSNAANSTLNIPLSGTGVTPGQLAASPASLSFGAVATGSSSTLALTLTNVGGSALTILQISTSGSGFSYSGIAPPVTLAPNQSVTLNVTFAPLTGGTVTGNLVASSNASNPTLSIPLSGSGTAPGQLVVSPATMNFGNVVVGSTHTQSATLTANNGPVTVSSNSVSQAEFTVSGLSLPLTIPAGYSTSFSVAFAPQATGAASANISFGSNASNTPTLQAVAGTGTTPPQHSVALGWTASSSSDVVGYNVYRGTVSGGPYAEINSAVAGTTESDSTVQAGQTYYYVVTAVDSAGKESSYSNQVKVVVPTP